MSYLTTLTGLGATNAWLFDESSGTSFADSVGSLTATGHGDWSAGRTSIVPALAFSAGNTSTGYANTAANIGAIGTGDFWLAFWVKSTEAGAKRLIGDSTSSITVFSNANKIVISLATLNITSSTSFNDGAAHFWCATRISGTVRWYLDGNTTNDASGSAGGSSSAVKFGFGADETGSFPCVATLGGVGLCMGTGLTGAQAATIYTAGNVSGGGPADPIGKRFRTNQAVKRAAFY